MKEKSTPKNPRAMILTKGIWTVWKFEFDAEDGQGVVWHQGRSTGDSVENSTRHFSEKGYAVVEWNDDV